MKPSHPELPLDTTAARRAGEVPRQAPAETPNHIPGLREVRPGLWAVIGRWRGGAKDKHR
jgi:hypothetical protein